MVFKIAITDISGKRVKLNKKFQTRIEARKFKNKIIDQKLMVIKRKGKSALTGFNPRVIKIRRTRKI